MLCLAACWAAPYPVINICQTGARGLPGLSQTCLKEKDRPETAVTVRKVLKSREPQQTFPDTHEYLNCLGLLHAGSKDEGSVFPKMAARGHQYPTPPTIHACERKNEAPTPCPGQWEAVVQCRLCLNLTCHHVSLERGGPRPYLFTGDILFLQWPPDKTCL